MKVPVKHSVFLGLFIVLLSSCYSPKFMVDDDVYMLKNNKLPVGESLNDESSYYNFKKKKTQGINSTRYADEEWRMRRNFHSPFGWTYGMNLYYINYPFGYRPDCWGVPYYFSPYPFSPCNPYYAYNPYGNPYFYDPYYYGSGYWNPYGNNGYYNNQYTNNPIVLGNHHSGPRGTIGGFGNPAGRLEGNNLKSITPAGVINKPQPQNSFSQRKIDNSMVIGQGKVNPNTVNSPKPIERKNEIRYTPSQERTIRNTGGNTNRQTPIRHENSRPVSHPNRTIEMNGGRNDNPSINRGGNSGGSNGSGRSGGSNNGSSGGSRRH